MRDNRAGWPGRLCLGLKFNVETIEMANNDNNDNVRPLKAAEKPGEQSASSERPLESFLPIDEHVEEISEGGRTVRRKGVYLLPNLFTSAALFAGFYAIVQSIQGDFAAAGLAIFFGQLLDGVDGRIARMTNTQSEFGAQYDSLSDCISFGVAPALVSYSWSLSSLGKIGWMVAFVFAACAALRLARFNVQIDTADKRYFTGLPSPAAAAVVAGMVWFGTEHGLDGQSIAIVAALITAFAAVMMVSNIKYNSFKELDFKGRVPFVAILVVVLVLAVIASYPAGVLLAIFLVYALSGPLLFFRRKK